MRLKSPLLIVIVTACSMSAFLAYADDSQTSLADVAKQKSSTKAKRVITDDDMPSTSGPTASAQAQIKDSGSSGSASTAGADPQDPNSKAPETAVPPKAVISAELENELKAVVHDEELLKKRLQQLQDKIDSTADPFRKQMYQDSIVNQQVTLQELGKKRRDLQQQIADEKAKPKS